MRLPWRGAQIPHALLDIVRGCNITCPGCYTFRPAWRKDLGRIAQELATIRRLRRVHTITIAGGECTTHPELPAVVRMVRAQGLRAALLTNGLLLQDPLLEALADAGLDLVLLHVQDEQHRADLPLNASPRAAGDLRRRIAERVARHGITAGLSLVVRQSRLGDVPALIREVIECPSLHYLLMTGYTAFARMPVVTGDSIGGLHVRERATVPESERREVVGCADIDRIMRAAGWAPFAYLPSNRDPDEPRWLSYVIGVARGAQGVTHAHALRSAASDRALLWGNRMVTGRHRFFYLAGPVRFRVQLALNALTGGRTGANLRLLREARRPGAVLEDKHVVFQQGPEVAPDGRLVYCRECPDSIVLNGRLVPTCLGDRMSDWSDNGGEKT